MKNNIFSFFTPKNNEYFVLLSDMADAVLTTSELTLECIEAQTYDEVVEYFTKIRLQKQKGAALQEKIIEELHNTFITPFDREDINSLAKNLKDVIDHISSSAKRIMLYTPKSMPEASRTLARLVKECAETIKLAVDKMDNLKKNPQEISDLCKKLEELENKTDEVYENFLVALFKNEKDAIEIIKLNDILHELEHATDSAERVGKIIGTIVVKYA